VNSTASEGPKLEAPGSPHSPAAPSSTIAVGSLSSACALAVNRSGAKISNNFRRQTMLRITQDHKPNDANKLRSQSYDDRDGVDAKRSSCMPDVTFSKAITEP